MRVCVSVCLGSLLHRHQKNERMTSLPFAIPCGIIINTIIAIKQSIRIVWLLFLLLFCMMELLKTLLSSLWTFGTLADIIIINSTIVASTGTGTIIIIVTTTIVISTGTITITNTITGTTSIGIGIVYRRKSIANYTPPEPNTRCCLGIDIGIAIAISIYQGSCFIYHDHYLILDILQEHNVDRVS